jgi:hypothetical protein
MASFPYIYIYIYIYIQKGKMTTNGSHLESVKKGVKDYTINFLEKNYTQYNDVKHYFDNTV